MKGLRLIRHRGGVVAGQSEAIELWIPGGTRTYTDKDDVHLINKWIRDAYRIGELSPENYVDYMMDEHGLW